MHIFHYYTRTGCHLCEVMLEELMPLIHGKAKLEIRCIDSRDDWREKYDIRVPVVECDGQVISEYPLNLSSVQKFLARTAQIDK